jgi:hypothetical protein
VLDSLRRTVDDPIAVVARENAMFVEATLPKYGIDGRVISPLRDEAGELVFTEAGKRIPGTNIIAEETVVTNDLVELINENQFVFLGRIDNIINSSVTIFINITYFFIGIY